MISVVMKTQPNGYFAFVIQVDLPSGLGWYFSYGQIIVSFLHACLERSLLSRFLFSS